ncbi:alpha/beta fold hydrolase [Massilia sp. Mn16-1_5]|uniref:alpha/beta fold hydrolase n=1 Tax=Massilia sp. Mn16-1_5 TaxID=2079199 RepID=UPI00109E84BE|nr:alpha/beta hydrolase [Massilia sp. Mn16-1_5]THC46616.1 alpha/beta hydrolase [Massilia sp. Mn16-1_5]
MTKPLLHFCHGNSFPSGTYRQLLDGLRVHYEVHQTDMVGHDPRYPVDDNWSKLVDELIEQVQAHGRPAILVGHSLGGMLSAMAAARRPELVRCVVMLDSPVVAGWRALAWRFVKWIGKGGRFSPGRFSERRRNVWPNRQAAFDHFMSKDIFAAWAPGVLDDYLEVGLKPHPEGVQLRFDRGVETAIYNSLPHHLGELLGRRYPVPVGFIGATRSEELRQAGLSSTRKLVGENFVMTEGSHLYPMEHPARAAQLTHEMIVRLLGANLTRHEKLTQRQA